MDLEFLLNTISQFTECENSDYLLKLTENRLFTLAQNIDEKEFLIYQTLLQ
jgi:hypothetical protein